MDEQSVLRVVEEISRAWLDGHADAMKPHIHPEIGLAFPGFSGRTRGAEAFLAGFRDFCAEARVLSFQASDHQVDVIGPTAVASFRFVMVYERQGVRFRATGRDLWVFALERGDWTAVWRTMLETSEEPA
jgi:hypothetical protein